LCRQFILKSSEYVALSWTQTGLNLQTVYLHCTSYVLHHHLYSSQELPDYMLPGAEYVVSQVI
jgi:hypothetical protein